MMKEVKQAILDAIEYARMGIAECENKLKQLDEVKKQIELAKLEISRHNNEITKLQSALRALGGAQNAPEESPSKTTLAPSDLPPTSMDFFEGCCDIEPRTSADIYFVAVSKLGIEKPTDLQQRLIKGRLSNALVNLSKADRSSRKAITAR
jgi:hypothetical protein